MRNTRTVFIVIAAICFAFLIILMVARPAKAAPVEENFGVQWYKIECLPGRGEAVYRLAITNKTDGTRRLYEDHIVYGGPDEVPQEYSSLTVLGSGQTWVYKVRLEDGWTTNLTVKNRNGRVLASRDLVGLACTVAGPR